MKKRILVFGALCMLFFAFRSAEMFVSIPENFGKPVYDFNKNPLTQEKVEPGVLCKLSFILQCICAHRSSAQSRNQ